MKLKSHLELLDEVESAFIDILDGNSQAHDICANTGLSEERSEEIEKLFHIVVDRYDKRHGLKRSA